MASFPEELLSAARILLHREPNRRGRLPDARVRRAVSTTYYALFHFLVEEATRRIAGTDNWLSGRRRILARTFTHVGLKATLSKIRGQAIDRSIENFLRARDAVDGQVVTPAFARGLANAYLDALSKREDADYNRNQVLSEADAKLLVERVEGAIANWKAADGRGDRDFKHAIFTLLLLNGQLRSDQ